MTHTKALNNLLVALKKRRRVTGQIHSISTEEVRVLLNQLPDEIARLKEMDPQGMAWGIQALIEEIGFLTLIRIAIAQTDEGTPALPPDPNHADPLDGDAGSTLAPAGRSDPDEEGKS